ncbi:MAG: xanthine dehydrogenase family protein subunit M [Planctomycetota bacterium]|nr:xanthine dehydrogenase family protein subunit M [Planctomycetota bacterium]MEC9349934.1 xanthine dehydrogenase family protein subunit M [Planctomycetota bacterium]MEE3230151.1 xanthine dehydrogenase family protein subunit M [Planctomycetota bacterium]
MKDFEYKAPATIDEAVTLLAERGSEARVLAGGTDIIVQLREGLRKAGLVVDVKKIPELMSLTWRDDGGLDIGAAVPCHVLYNDAKVVNAYPSITDSAKIIGGWQIQGRASLGGNLCNSSPAADSIPALIVEGVTCRIAGPGGERLVPVQEFCTAPGANVLTEGEMLVSLALPPAGESSGSRYMRFIPRNEMDIAVTGAGAWLRLGEGGETVEEARLALSAVAPTPVVAGEAEAWLQGKPATEESFAEAGNIARKAASPISDMRGPADYRTHLVGVLVKRALNGALGRARGGDRNPVIPSGINLC